MDAEEVEHRQRHGDESLQGARRRDRSALFPLDDPVVLHLEASALPSVVAVQHLMELEHDADGERHRRVRLVDQRERAAVAGDLLFRAIPRLARSGDQRLDAPT